MIRHITYLKMRKNTYEISVLTLLTLSIPMPKFDINKANKNDNHHRVIDKSY
jgi:hypothetical protein